MEEFGEWLKRRDAEAVEAEREAAEARRIDREEKIERRMAIEAEDAVMARNMYPSSARAKAVANPKPVTKNKR